MVFLYNSLTLFQISNQYLVKCVLQSHQKFHMTSFLDTTYDILVTQTKRAYLWSHLSYRIQISGCIKQDKELNHDTKIKNLTGVHAELHCLENGHSQMSKNGLLLAFIFEHVPQLCEDGVKFQLL